MTSMMRARWAAVGAAVAVSLGAAGLSVTDALTMSGEKPILVPIEPCRLADSRPDSESFVGPLVGPLGSNGERTYLGWGDVDGACNLPTGTAGLSLNVTITNATQATNVRLYPADAPLPLASNLNPRPGAPVFNAVNVDLDPTGEFKVYNANGSVDVIIDVVGYLDDHNHDDRYYTKDQANALAAASFAVQSGPDTVAVEANPGMDPPDLVNSLTVAVPGPGQLLVNVTGNYSAVLSNGLNPGVFCQLTNDGSFGQPAPNSRYEAHNPPGSTGRSEADIAMSRVFEVSGPGSVELEVLCYRTSGRVLASTQIVAHYIP